jgi:hypothetical protein
MIKAELTYEPWYLISSMIIILCHPWLPLIYTFTFLLVTMHIILNLESNIKIILWFLSSSNPLKNETTKTSQHLVLHVDFEFVSFV